MLDTRRLKDGRLQHVGNGATVDQQCMLCLKELWTYVTALFAGSWLEKVTLLILLAVAIVVVAVVASVDSRDTHCC